VGQETRRRATCGVAPDFRDGPFPLRDESWLNMATAAGHRVSGSPAHAPSRDELLPGERRPGHARDPVLRRTSKTFITPSRYAELAAGTFKDIGGISPSQSGRRRRPESRRGVREKEAPFVMEGTVKPWPSESGPGSRHWPRMDWRSGLLISSVGVRRLVGN
jgi:hypothetical protein